MSDSSTKSYSFSEIAQILGVDEKLLYRYAHKGLINPELSNADTARFTEVDCVRLKIIKRADELGYSPEGIFNLIGMPDEVLKSGDPIAACEDFAIGKYKQIYDELYHCEPLEQLNKQCDLRLLKRYISHLKELQKNTPPGKRPAQAEHQSMQVSALKGDQQSQGALEKRPKSAPQIQSYSVEKLWDYINKVEQLGKDASSNFQPIGSEPQTKPQHVGEADQFSQTLQDAAQMRSTDQRHLNAESGKTLKGRLAIQVQSLRKTAAGRAVKTWSGVHHFLNTKSWSAQIKRPNILKPRIPKTVIEMAGNVWVGVGLLILILAIPTYFMLFGSTGDVSQAPVTPSRQLPQSAIEKNAPKPKALPESTQPTMVAKPAFTPDQPDKELSLDQRPGESTSLEPGLGAQAQINTAAEKSMTPVTQSESGTDRRSEPSAPADNQLSGNSPLSKEQLVDSKPPSPIQIMELSIFHDPLNHVYRANFTIQKNEPTGDEELISGYVFVYLEPGGEDAGYGGLLLPSGQLVAGKPAQFRQGAKFAIRRMKESQITVNSTLSPVDISACRVFVYSSEGDLLLEKHFNTSIQPFFAVTEKPSVSGDAKTQASAESTPFVSAQPESQTSDAPEPQPADRQTTAMMQTTGQSETQAVSAVGSNSGTEAASTSITVTASDEESPERTSGTDLSPGNKVQPKAKVEKTDNPEAAVWEQKSYDAAVQGDFSRAVADATKAIELDPGRINPYITRSWAYIQTNLLKQAIKDCSTALLIDPQNAYAYNNRGLAHQRSAYLQSAKNDYRKACDLGLNLGCQNFDAITNQARIAELIDQSQTAFKAKNWDDVIRTTTEVIKLDPQNAVAYTNRSAAYVQKNFLNKALKDSNEAIANNPDFALAYNNRGYVFELLGSNRKATADYLKSCSLGLDLGCKNYERLNRTR